MATNVTPDAIKFFEKELKDCQIHLDKAIQRMTNYNEVKLPKKKANPKNKNWQNKEPIDIESKPEVKNLRKKIAHYELAIQAIKEKQDREEKKKYLFKKRF